MSAGSVTRIALHTLHSQYGATGMAKTVSCLTCGISFQAQRTTAAFCGGTCRQRFNRGAQRAGLPPLNGRRKVKEREPSVVKEITAIRSAVDAFTARHEGEYLLDVVRDALRSSIEDLNQFIHPLCTDCEREANGWENLEYCRRCEISIFDLRCANCDTRRPSVASDAMLCRQCEEMG